MNSAVKKLIILQSLLLIGCSSQNLVIDTFIPKPLVKMNENITAKLTFDEQIKNTFLFNKKLEKHSFGTTYGGRAKRIRKRHGFGVSGTLKIELPSKREPSRKGWRTSKM